MFRKMGRWTGNFFVAEMSYSHNAHVLGDADLPAASEAAEAPQEMLDSDSETSIAPADSPETDSSDSDVV